MYYSLYNWIGEHEISKLAKNICFKSRKKDTKTSTKGHEWNGMTQNGLFDIFQQCTCVNVIYFAPVVSATYRLKNDKSSTRSVSLKMSVLLKRVRNCLIFSTLIHTWAYHMEKMSRRLLYIYRNWYYLWIELSGRMGFVLYGLGAD